MLKSKIIKFLSDTIGKDVETRCTNNIIDIINPYLKEATGKEVLNVIKVDGEPKTRQLKGVTHEKFKSVLQLVNLDIPVYLTGEAGSGKNVICKQIAEALGLEFYFTNAVTQEYRLTGFIDASGRYHETQFYKAFKNGGLFFLDELDASIPEVLVILNAAIANRYFDFPTGKVEANKNFRLVAAGNTTGTGADSVYSGRYCLDGASMDRFSIIPIPYSTAIELSITNKDEDLIDFCHAYRNTVKEAGINSIFSYRGLTAITKLKNSRMPLPEILKICLTKGMSGDDLNTIKGNIKCSPANKYLIAFKEL